MKDTYLFVYTFVNGTEKWHIALSNSYTLVIDIADAQADANDENQNERCPQGLDYDVFLKNKWTNDTTMSVSVHQPADVGMNSTG